MTLPVSVKYFILKSAIVLLIVISYVGTHNNALAQTSPIAEISKTADKLSQTVRIVSRLSDNIQTDDEALAGARVKFQNVITTVIELVRKIDEQSKSVTERLAEIGPAPEAEGQSEPEVVTDTRNNLLQVRSTLVATKTELEGLRETAEQSIANITLKRQQAFSDAITKRTSLTPQMLRSAGEGLVSEFASTRSLVTNWLTIIYQTKFWQATGSALISLAIAIFLSFNFRRYFGIYLQRDTANPDYFKRVFTAFWKTVLPSLATVIFLTATYLLFTSFQLFTPVISQIVYALFSLIAGTVFAWNFSRAIFAPKAPEWRLLPISTRAAKTLFWLVFILTVIYSLDALLSAITTALAGPLDLTVVRGIIASVLIGAILIAIAVINPGFRKFAAQTEATNETAVSTSGSARKDWPKWISIPLILSGGIIIISAIAGYIGFAKFFSQQLVVTGAIVSIMTIGYLAAKELAREGVLVETNFGRSLIHRGYEPYKVEQFSLATGIVFILLVTLIGIPAIFLQWGTQPEEILAFARRAFTGIDIGNFRLSLSGILIGLAVFAFVILITRFLKGWLSTSVFPRSKVDIGVSESIKAGVGYVGFAVAGLLAITSAGIDLSNLAIIAGALSLGIGFGLQNIVSNFVSGLILLVERPIKVGDWIRVGAAEGTVKRISVRATEIETFQRQAIIIPNSELINSQVNNWTLKNKFGRVDINVGVAYGTDVRLVERTLYEIGLQHAMVAKKPEPSVWFANFGDSSLDFRLRMFVNDIYNLVIVETEVRFEILKRFQDLGIEIPFPQRDLNIKLSEHAPEDFASQMAGSMSAALNSPADKVKSKAKEKTSDNSTIKPRRRTSPSPG